MSDDVPRCVWCHGVGELVPIDPEKIRVSHAGVPPAVFAHEEHLDELFAFLADVHANRTKFMVCMLGVLFAMPSAVVAHLLIPGWPWRNVPPAMVLAGVAVILVRFPYGTPQTIEWLGVVRTRQLIWIGAALILLLATRVLIM